MSAEEDASAGSADIGEALVAALGFEPAEGRRLGRRASSVSGTEDRPTEADIDTVTVENMAAEVSLNDGLAVVSPGEGSSDAGGSGDSAGPQGDTPGDAANPNRNNGAASSGASQNRSGSKRSRKRSKQDRNRQNTSKSASGAADGVPSADALKSAAKPTVQDGAGDGTTPERNGQGGDPADTVRVDTALAPPPGAKTAQGGGLSEESIAELAESAAAKDAVVKAKGRAASAATAGGAKAKAGADTSAIKGAVADAKAASSTGAGGKTRRSGKGAAGGDPAKKPGAAGGDGKGASAGTASNGPSAERTAAEPTTSTPSGNGGQSASKQSGSAEAEAPPAATPAAPAAPIEPTPTGRTAAEQVGGAAGDPDEGPVAAAAAVTGELVDLELDNQPPPPRPDDAISVAGQGATRTEPAVDGAAAAALGATAVPTSPPAKETAPAGDVAKADRGPTRVEPVPAEVSPAAPATPTSAPVTPAADSGPVAVPAAAKVDLGRPATGIELPSWSDIFRRRRRVQARKVRRVVRHIDPWSVLTFSVLFHLCVFAALLLASVLVWNAAEAAGTIENIETFILELGDYETFEINGDAVFRAAVAIAGILTLASSVLLVLLTVVFNLISDLVGGIRLTVIEEETVRVRRKKKS